MSFGQVRPVEMSAQLHFWQKSTISAQIPHTNYQHGGGGVIILACFIATGSEHLAVTESP